MIATVAGASLIQYRVSQERPPLAGACLLAMGGLYMYVGSGLYVWQVWKLAAPLRLGKWTIFWALFNAGWPLTLWSVSLACLLDETPTVLLDGLRLIEGQLPSMLHASLFLDPPALYPVCVILRAVVAHEQQRLARIHGHATGSHVSTMVRAGPLTDSDVATIITKRLERIGALQAKIDLLARSTDAVPTALIAPLLDTLNTEALMLEKVLEVRRQPLAAPCRPAVPWSPRRSACNYCSLSLRALCPCLRDAHRWTRPQAASRCSRGASPSSSPRTMRGCSMSSRPCRRCAGASRPSSSCPRTMPRASEREVSTTAQRFACPMGWVLTCSLAGSSRLLCPNIVYRSWPLLFVPVVQYRSGRNSTKNGCFHSVLAKVRSRPPKRKSEIKIVRICLLAKLKVSSEIGAIPWSISWTNFGQNPPVGKNFLS